jgi:hypothetical protein
MHLQPQFEKIAMLLFICRSPIATTITTTTLSFRTFTNTLVPHKHSDVITYICLATVVDAVLTWTEILIIVQPRMAFFPASLALITTLKRPCAGFAFLMDDHSN